METSLTFQQQGLDSSLFSELEWFSWMKDFILLLTQLQEEATLVTWSANLKVTTCDLKST